MREPAFVLEDYAPYLINRAATGLLTRFVVVLKPYDLTLPMYRVLAILNGRGALRVGVLRGLSLLEPPTLSRILITLEERKLVSRSKSDSDGRGATIDITSDGRALVRELVPWTEQMNAVAMQGLSADEAEFFTRLLKRVCRNIAPGPAKDSSLAENTFVPAG